MRGNTGARPGRLSWAGLVSLPGEAGAQIKLRQCPPCEPPQPPAPSRRRTSHAPRGWEDGGRSRHTFPRPASIADRVRQGRLAVVPERGDRQRRCVKCVTLEPGGGPTFNRIALIHPARTDEYVGLPREHPESYHTFMWCAARSRLRDPNPAQPSHAHTSTVCRPAAVPREPELLGSALPQPDSSRHRQPCSSKSRAEVEPTEAAAAVPHAAGTT